MMQLTQDLIPVFLITTDQFSFGRKTYSTFLVQVVGMAHTSLKFQGLSRDPGQANQYILLVTVIASEMGA